MRELSRCLDVDTLVTLGNAFGWKMPHGLPHLEECADCRARLEQLGRVTVASKSAGSAAPSSRETDRARKADSPIGMPVVIEAT
jgi:hypothetical protein